MNYTKEKTGRDVNMKKLLAIGEALIDFIPRNTGVPIKQVESFKPAVGGAPANVC
ncbi:PfkB family kinase, partial [human gut metagenome]